MFAPGDGAAPPELAGRSTEQAVLLRCLADLMDDGALDVVVADRFAAREGLNRLSYVWCPPGQQPPVVWSAGIPSLTSYVLAQAPESATQPSRVAPRSEDLSRR